MSSDYTPDFRSLVGDFFRSALKNGLVDAKATFPPPKHLPVSPAASAPAEDWAIEASAPENPRDASPAASDVVVHRDGDGVSVGDKASGSSPAPSDATNGQ